MNIRVFASPAEATIAAADLLQLRLTDPAVRRVMVAGGNTPLDLYREIARRRLPLSHLRVYVLDEYVGVPENEPRTCSNLLRAGVAQAWGIPEPQFLGIRSTEHEALKSIRQHQERIEHDGRLDIAVLGLGTNGHLGFNEPGSQKDAEARIVDLSPESVAANRDWFRGRYAPDKGATIGLSTILTARTVVVLAFGPRKADAVRRMAYGPIGPECPASFLQAHADAWVFLDHAAVPK